MELLSTSLSDPRYVVRSLLIISWRPIKVLSEPCLNSTALLHSRRARCSFVAAECEGRDHTDEATEPLQNSRHFLHNVEPSADFPLLPVLRYSSFGI